MKYLKEYQGAPGFSKIIGEGEMGLKLTQFGIIRLMAGASLELSNGANETALIVLSGVCEVSGTGFQFKGVGARESVFAGKPHTVYIPCGSEYRVKASSDVEIAWTESPSSLKTKAAHIAPGAVSQVTIGKRNAQRDAFIMIDDKFSAEHLFIGEAIVPPGNWASYPPHRHDFDNLPVEVDMEEIYFFKFNPVQGFGIQKIYTDSRSIDETYTIKHDDTVGIPEGYHPVVCAPGYTMWYLWIMAGKNRKFLSYKDPAHAWAAEA